MLYDKTYKYTIINETIFNNKYLECKNDGSKYKNYIIVCYKDGNDIKYIDIPNENYLNKINNIIKTYNVEEIVSTCIYFDNMYDELYYFHIDDIYFTKYLMDDEYTEHFKLSDDSEHIRNYIEQ